MRAVVCHSDPERSRSGRIPVVRLFPPPHSPRTKIKPCSPPPPRCSDIRAKIDARERISPEEALCLWREASDADMRSLASQVRARFHSPGRLHLPGHAHHQLHQRLRRPVRLLRLLQAPRPGGRLRPLARTGLRQARRTARPRRRPRRLQRRLQPASSARLLLRALLRHPHTATATAWSSTRSPSPNSCTSPTTPTSATWPQPSASKQAGVRWITGGGSEILTEDFRARHSKFKYTVADYFAAQRALVDAGLRTSATMVIGFDETIEERIEHLERTRAFQDSLLADSLVAAGSTDRAAARNQPSPASSAGPTSPTSPSSAASRSPPPNTSATSPSAAFTSTTSPASAPPSSPRTSAPSKACSTAPTTSTCPSKTKSPNSPAPPSASTSTSSSPPPAPSASPPPTATSPDYRLPSSHAGSKLSMSFDKRTLCAKMFSSYLTAAETGPYFYRARNTVSRAPEPQPPKRSAREAGSHAEKSSSSPHVTQPHPPGR